LEAELKEFNGEADHVHLLVHYPPKAAVPKLVNSPKGVSARIPRRDFTGRMNTHRDHPRAPLAPVLLRSILRRSATVDHPAIHPTTATPGLTAGPRSRMR
jgi:hypothetical protein